jgi:hypothetical protein
MTAYVPIASQVLTTTAASVTFSGIPATYGDLVLIIDSVGDGSNQLYLRFNGDTGSNYHYISARGPSFNVTGTNTTRIELGNLTTDRNVNVVNVFDYAATNKHKLVVARSNMPTANTKMIHGRWANTAAITSVTLTSSGVNFAASSTFSLYGIEV